MDKREIRARLQAFKGHPLVEAMEHLLSEVERLEAREMELQSNLLKIALKVNEYTERLKLHNPRCHQVGCRETINLTENGYRCLYCGEYWCAFHAKEHFEDHSKSDS
ncbi:hypothetical protein LCGC14_0386490 [marine sediment metagenome]|uniref:Uncharacterized protein n=1 Tax=marine sediment metagenome TaxID=412755 RepID=A0A0F9T0X2_9ZZZZ